MLHCVRVCRGCCVRFLEGRSVHTPPAPKKKKGSKQKQLQLKCTASRQPIRMNLGYSTALGIAAWWVMYIIIHYFIFSKLFCREQVPIIPHTHSVYPVS